MKIAIDMMGGDYAPLEAVKGIALYLADDNIPATLVLIGDQPAVESLLAEHKISSKNIPMLI